MYRVLSCVLYYIIYNYVRIEYLYCLSKTLISIYSDKILKQASYNILLGIGIPEVLMDLVSCHGFMEKSNSTVILNLRSRLVNHYLEKGFVIIKHNSKQLISLPNDAKLRIHAIDQLEAYFVMAKITEIYSVANTINILHTQSDFNLIYKKNFYHYKEREMDKCFDGYHLTLLNTLIIQNLLKNRNEIFMLLPMKNLNKEIKLPPDKKEIDRHSSISYCPTSIKEVINWFTFMNTMDYIADKIDNEITLLPSLLNIFSMFQMRFWYNKEHDDQNNVEI